MTMERRHMKTDKQTRLPGLTLVTVMLAVAACAQAESEDKPKLTLDSEPLVAVDIDADEKLRKPIGPGLQGLVDLASKTLALNVGVDAAAIGVSKAEFVTWRDSSLGCPQPGMQYLQVMTNGSRIVLSAGGKKYNFHSGGNTPPTYCPKPSAEEPLPYGPGES